MRTMKIIGICMVLCFLQNCGTDRIDIIRRAYRLENGTSSEIKIEFYRYGIFKHTQHIIGEGLIFEGSMDNDGGAHLSAGGALGADSIIVVFDNQKKQIYYHGDIVVTATPPTDRNVLLNEAYEIINDELYRFTFTEADYENAEEIGG
ncbi:hypothetical protein GCM10009122_25610 [Fulvivirga kasyanovii]|uniref:DUF4369 domain-containing protein n=1 Tax=Fulvivirga kasyanovii TaxID=396812 RepID=A0ABW9RPJ1_9BACT|nr:hypothetical protein [Fulvivirga kasyanovii]MTI26063.1 hypothetical protein [Fulvivirga kasyanovii]